MLFNSLEFIIFFHIIFAVYWLLKNNYKQQNVLLFLASYFFYGWWSWKFAFLIFFSSIVDYTLGRLIHQEEDEKLRKRYLLISFFINFGILGFFKYFNFFITEAVNLIEIIGFQANYTSLALILPIGISFYTFQTLSYTIDVYKRNIEPTNDFLAFSTFVCFFPQLVAGPVERASTLLPQFLRKRSINFERAKEACQQILWGFFKKIVIADSCALYVNDIFGYHNYDEVSGILLIVGGVLFAIQIYADFAGYSDIAIGTARLLGFDLLQNFDFPYHSKSITEMWRRWHISISSWFRDYLFMPLSLGLRNHKKKGVIYSFLITYGLIGLWHGANWTFVIFGLIHGGVILIERFTKKSRRKLKKKMPEWIFNSLAWTITMIVWVLAVIIFRAENMTLAISFIANIFDNLLLFDYQQILGRDIFTAININPYRGLALSLLIAFMFLVEWLHRKHEFGFKLSSKYTVVNWAAYYLVVIALFFFGEFNQQEFIYFHF